MGKKETGLERLSNNDLLSLINQSRISSPESVIATSELIRRSQALRAELHESINQSIDNARDLILDAIPESSRTPELLKKLDWIASLAKHTRE